MATKPTGPSKPVTDPNEFRAPDPALFAQNMAKVAAKSHELVGDWLSRQGKGPAGGPADPLNIAGTFIDLMSKMMADPAYLVRAQLSLWGEYLKLWQHTTDRLMGKEVVPLVTPAAGDKRFKHPDWEQNAVFDFIKQSYLLTANWLHKTTAEVEGLDDRTRKRVDFYTKQFADALAPTNFVLTNPEVLRATLSSSGQNLVDGLENLLEDLERGGGQLAIRQTDMDHFKVGENIATAPGKVVYRNDLMELLQFDPSTDQVRQTPLLVFPPWINKFYILDLRPENSFIRWATAKGYTVFVASWVNPDERLSTKTFEDYMREGILAGLDAVEKATGERQANVIGYCIGGTLLSATLAYMAATGEDRIKSATFFAAQADFSEPGDLSVFIDDHQLKALEEQMRAAGGYLEGQKMATTFNMLRSNDLIWSFVVNNYLLGKDPIPFDLLFWNADATRMPIDMHLFYLRECYRDNKLAKGEMVLGGKTLDLHKVKVPIFLQSSREDHIAPYRSVYKSTRLFGGPVTFMMAGSGHIAGVINHPDAKKYQHWTNPDLPEKVEDWVAGATEHPGSWWPMWEEWLRDKSGDLVPARKPGDRKLKVLGDAPGEYVKMKG